MKNYSITKWAGGKQHELNKIIEFLPKEKINRYFEPFVGGGSVFGKLMQNSFSSEYYINDISTNLINLYMYTKKNDVSFFNELNNISKLWNQFEELADKHKEDKKLLKKYRLFEKNKISDNEFKDFISSIIILDSQIFNILFNDKFNKNILDNLKMIQDIIFYKFKKAKQISYKNNIRFSDNDINNTIESSYKSFVYNVLRKIYNNSEEYKVTLELKTAIFLFLREYCYGSMFRFNNNGDFNVPYGGIAYNNKKVITKIDKIKELSYIYNENNLSIYNSDFYEFLINKNLTNSDFIFLDPPYTTIFNEYDNNSFDLEQHIKLRDFLKKTKAKFMMIIDGSEFIKNIYNDKMFSIITYDKKYAVNIKNRNNQKIVHLLIRNYEE